MSGRTVVLVYHRVADPRRDPSHLAVHPDRFAEQVAELGRHGEVVPLEAAVERHRGRRIAVTFDDGYADNLTAALPVLEAAGVPATVFVTTGVLTGAELWWDRLEHVVHGAPPPSGHLRLDVGPAPVTVDVRTAEGRARAVRALSRRLRVLPPGDVAAAMASLEAQVGRDGPGAGRACADHAVLDADGLRRLAASPLVDIGAHTRTHANLGRLDEAARIEEIEGSRDDLREVLGASPVAFAYPFGMAGSFDRDTERLVRRAGFRLACANVAGRATPRLRWRLPRVVVGQWSGAELGERLEQWLGGRGGTP